LGIVYIAWTSLALSAIVYIARTFLAPSAIVHIATTFLAPSAIVDSAPASAVVLRVLRLFYYKDAFFGVPSAIECAGVPLLSSFSVLLVAVILRECGFDERTIADALGQRTIEMARLYARGADLTRKMESVSKKFGREVNRRRTKVSNQPEKVSNLKASSKERR
jgi:hypothetical protein